MSVFAGRDIRYPNLALNGGISASFNLSSLKGDSLSASSASKSTQNPIRFRFKEFFTNYFLSIQGKYETNTVVLVRLLTQ